MIKMSKNIDQYIEASDASFNVRKEFASLVSRIPSLSKDKTEACIQVKEALRKCGFSYNHRMFKIQDVLSARGGNCLGLPLLVGAILGEFGFDPTYQIIVNPKDKIYELENLFYKKLNEEMPYDRPALARIQEEFPIYRFVPLEHLVIDTNGKFHIETTSQEHHATECESARPLTFSQALSCVYKDRAVQAEMKGRLNVSMSLALKATELWQENKQAYALITALAIDKKDDSVFEKSIIKFNEIKGEDSLFNFNKYLFSKDLTYLDKSLQVYPPYAQAISKKGTTLIENNPREARFLLALASHLYANSTVLNLRDFYAVNLESLKKLFSQEDVRAGLQGI